MAVEPNGRIVFMGNLRQAVQSLILARFATNGMARINGFHRGAKRGMERGSKPCIGRSSNRASRRVSPLRKRRMILGSVSRSLLPPLAQFAAEFF